MKLSSISLVGATLAAIVVSAIASVPRSLEQLERDMDSELVDGLFTRVTSEERRVRRAAARQAAHEAELEAARQYARQLAARQAAARQVAAEREAARQARAARQQAAYHTAGAHGNVHNALGSLHLSAGTEHHLAYVEHTEAFEKTKNDQHRQIAWQHSQEAAYHFDQSEQNFAVYGGTQIDGQENLIKDRHNPLQATRQCKTNATRSKEYASRVIAHHDSNGLEPHPGAFNEHLNCHPIVPMPGAWTPH